MDVIAARTPAALARYQERLRERIAGLLGDIVLDQGRLLTEVALWADKTDVREEMTRLRAHSSSSRCSSTRAARSAGRWTS